MSRSRPTTPGLSDLTSEHFPDFPGNYSWHQPPLPGRAGKARAPPPLSPVGCCPAGPPALPGLDRGASCRTRGSTPRRAPGARSRPFAPAGHQARVPRQGRRQVLTRRRKNEDQGEEVPERRPGSPLGAEGCGAPRCPLPGAFGERSRYLPPAGATRRSHRSLRVVPRDSPNIPGLGWRAPGRPTRAPITGGGRRHRTIGPGDD